jgi:ribosomal protein L11 methyltransferase
VPWLQLRWPAAPELVPRLSEALEECGAISVSVSGEEDEHRLQAATEETSLWSQNWVTGLFAHGSDIAGIAACLQRQLGAELAAPISHVLSDEDWSESWKANYHPLPVTPRLWICPSWLAPPDPSAVTIILDPGLAFGTGDHPTTFLCLEWLAAQTLAGRTVLDYGCGSGILAIAALKLGAAHAWAVDIDPQAVGITRENAARNGVLARLSVGDPDSLPPDLRADVVIANILARPLVELAPVLTARVARPGGRLALSGMLEDQRILVEAAYTTEFELTASTRNGWVLLAGTRRGA